MTGENGSPETPDWQLPRPAEPYEAPAIPTNITLGTE